MNISIIAAVSTNNAIGKDNDLIWHLPKDMRFFMETTVNHHVIMGRKNYDSIPEKYRPLKNRTNVIVTRKTDFIAPNCEIVNSIEEGIELAKKNNETECFIIGGGQIYEQAMNSVNQMYITHIDESFEGDTFFPDFDTTLWNSEVIMSHQKDEKDKYDFVVKKYTLK